MQKLLGLTWTEVNLDAIAQNVKNIKKLIGEKKELMAVVKGNAYGHDILEVSPVVLENGATRLAVARLEEAIFLRKAGITVPILVLGLPLKQQAEFLVSYDITPAVCEFEMIEKLSELAVQMNKMTKIAKWAIGAALIAMPLVSFAAVNLPPGTAIDLNKIQSLIETIANFLIIIGVIVAVIFIVWGGIKYITARGNDKAVEEARKTIFNGIIGAAVILGVGVILNTTASLVTRSFFGAGQ